MASSILLTNATILVPSGEENDYVVALRHHSLLIEGNKIAQIAPEIAPPSPHTKILDCTGKIISPGFIDTHHHLWQTQLKGRHANHTLMDYMSTGTELTFRRLRTLRSILTHSRSVLSSRDLHLRGYILGPTGRLFRGFRCGDYNGCGPCSFEYICSSL